MTIFSTFNYSNRLSLLGAGVDCEKIDRFVSLDKSLDNPLPLVFADQEIIHARKHYTPHLFLCTAFCCKEALLKAAKTPFDLTACILVSFDDQDNITLLLKSDNGLDLQISEVVAKRIPVGPRHIGVMVLLFGERADFLKTAL